MTTATWKARGLVRARRSDGASATGSRARRGNTSAPAVALVEINGTALKLLRFPAWRAVTAKVED